VRWEEKAIPDLYRFRAYVVGRVKQKRTEPAIAWGYNISIFRIMTPLNIKAKVSI
jgi:hypothetical protein